MKKTKTLRLAGGLLVLCLITLCVIGTTFAKYTTGGTAEDSARVAKWGVKIEMSGSDVFKNEYSKTDTVYSGTLSVESSSDENVVAPGTNSNQAGKAIFKITGTPEVASRISIQIENVKDVKLVSGTYKDPTQASGTFTLDSDYTPVKFTLKQTLPTESAQVLKVGTLAEIKTYLNETYNSKEYNANTTLDASYELSWEWSFEGGNDKADTYLGNLMAGQNADSLDDTKYSLNVGYKISITITQID